MVKGKQNSLFLILPAINSKLKQVHCEKINVLDTAKTLSQFKGAQPDHIQVKHLSCYFPRESMSFDL